MKKLICLLMAAVMVLALMGCDLFSDSTIVKFNDSFTHKDPEGLKYDQRIALKRDDFEKELEYQMEASAYPDTVMYGEDGSYVGLYDYDPTTGMAVGWTDLSTGEYHAYSEDEQVFLGLPDESIMMELAGSVTLGFVVYGQEGKAVCAYLYFILSDGADLDAVEELSHLFFDYESEKVSDTVLCGVLDEAYIANDFDMYELYYEDSYENEDAADYADFLKNYYSVREFGGANPYKPYAGHTDPEGLEFDEKTVLTGSGEYAVADPYYKDMKCLTDYVYGKDGKVIAHYTYYEFGSKETVDEMMKDPDSNFFNGVRISDTVVQGSLTGDKLESVITSYIGYGVLESDSFDDYVAMVADSNLSEIVD